GLDGSVDHGGIIARRPVRRTLRRDRGPREFDSKTRSARVLRLPEDREWRASTARQTTERRAIMSIVRAKRQQDAPTFGSPDDRWAAVLRRDRRADGALYYSLPTTRRYCRP